MNNISNQTKEQKYLHNYGLLSVSIMDSCRSWSMIQWLGFPLEFIETVCAFVNSTFVADYWLNNASFGTTRSHHAFYSNGSCIDHPTQFDEWNQWIDTKFDALEGITPNSVLLLDPIGAEELVRSYTSRDSMLHLINDQLSCQNKCELKIKTLKRKIHLI